MLSLRRPRLPHLALRHYLANVPLSTNTNHAISVKQQLYTTDPVTPGSIFFLPHGTRIMNKLIQFMKHQQMRYGFEEVITPLIYKNQLWKTSGHWDNYRDDMFKVTGNVVHEHEDPQLHEYGLKPMNCPGHCVIFSKFERSYNELPIRLSDFSSLHRNEASGALSGLTRVRRFHQDDGHIFCEFDQVEDEISNTVNLILESYKVFGIPSNEIKFTLSTRPEDKYIGEISTWEKAEEKLSNVLTNSGNSWTINPGDGAFYGPKIDVQLTDAFGKAHQVGTIQLDFQLPARFDLKYIDKHGSRENRPIMIHRAVFGSLERFFAILLDHYQGKWPFWLNPRQALIIPVNDSHVSAAQEIKKQISGDIVSKTDIAPMTGHNFFIDIDSRSETVGIRIKDAIQKGYSYILMVGDKDIQNGTVACRTLTSRKVENMTPKALLERFISHEINYE